MNNVTTEIKNRIRAILAKAESTEHEGEAAVFMAKAQELMEKYQVELFELHTEDPIGVTMGCEGQQGPPKYKTDVQCYLARYYGCRGITTGTTKHWRVELVGPESARITTEIMTDFVWAQVCKEASHLAKTHPGKNRAMWIRDIAKALCVRLYQLSKAKETQPAKEGTSYSLVVVDAVANYLALHYPKLKTGKAKTVSYAKAAGEAANNIKINQQFGGKDRIRLE